MVFAYCPCGWSAFTSELPALNEMHVCQAIGFLFYRQFTQSRMAPDGVSQLLTEAQWIRGAA